MCIKNSPNAPRSFAPVKTRVTVGLLTLAALAIAGLYLLGAGINVSPHSNPGSQIDACNRQAMDQLTREIRQSKPVLIHTTNSLAPRAGNDEESVAPAVLYHFDPGTGKLLPAPAHSSCPVISDWSNHVKVLKLRWRTSITTPNRIPSQHNRYYDYSPKPRVPDNMPALVLSHREPFHS